MTASRRRLLRMSAALGGALTACKKSTAPSADAEPSQLGKPPSGYGERSPYVKSLRKFRVSKRPENGSSATPLAECYGIITPGGLHFERHHAGDPALKPEEHRLLIHRLAERPLVSTMAD